MSLRSWVELVTTIIMSDQNVSAETKEKLGGEAYSLLTELEAPNETPCSICGYPEYKHSAITHEFEPML